MKIVMLLTLVAGTCAAVMPSAQATEVTGLNTFTAGTPARAAEVNGNFSAVKTAVDDNHARITVLESGSGASQATLTNHENRIGALEAADVLGPLMYGTGSAGDLVISTNTNWQAVGAPTNLNFNNVTIQSGVTLQVPSGTTIRCTGSFTNNGTIQVVGVAAGGVREGMSAGVSGGARSAHPGDTGSAASLSSSDSDGAFGILFGGSGGTAIPRANILSNLSNLRFGGGGGGGGGANLGGTGGGLIRILCDDAISSSGTISADGTTGHGGGGGGIVVLASRTSVANSGTINVRGGAGRASAWEVGAGGGGGGGFAVLIAPTVANVGTINVAGGLAGSASDPLTNPDYRSGGGGGGASAGNGGNGGTVFGTSSNSAQAGAAGVVLTLEQDPFFIVR